MWRAGKIIKKFVVELFEIHNKDRVMDTKPLNNVLLGHAQQWAR
jgi:hypothetical protein